MDDSINITQKLLKIVKLRKTPIIINKQESSYKGNRKVGKSIAFDSYSYNSDD